ncbi:MAG: hypothetical protein JW836_17130 [Deltaproteobacteria bacterium]|nr:hypothetical protein [Deltaproteobacteria bacterium]
MIIDVSGEALAEALKEGVYLIKLNVREFRELVGEDIKEESQIKAEAQRMVKNGWCEVLVISLFQGPDKSHLFRPRKSRPVGAVMFQPPDPGVVIFRIRSLQLKNTCFTLLIHSCQAANLNIVWGSVRLKVVWIDITEPATADSG